MHPESKKRNLSSRAQPPAHHLNLYGLATAADYAMDDALRNLICDRVLPVVYSVGGPVADAQARLLPRQPYPSLEDFHEWKRRHARIYRLQKWLNHHGSAQLLLLVSVLLAYPLCLGWAAGWTVGAFNAGGLLAAVLPAIVACALPVATMQPFLYVVGFLLGDDP